MFDSTSGRQFAWHSGGGGYFKGGKRFLWIAAAVVLLIIIANVPQSREHLANVATNVKDGIVQGVCPSSEDEDTLSEQMDQGLSPSREADLHRPANGTQSKYAYCVFLDDYSSGTNKDDLLHGPYFLGARMLAYQLLHDPETRTTNNIPFLVLVPEGYSTVKKHRLELDGAQVIEVSSLAPDWIQPDQERWRAVLSKLHIFNLVQYEKIALMDADIVVISKLDDVFTAPETDILYNKNMTGGNITQEDEGPQPTSYMFAGVKETERYNMPYMNAGFVVVHPSHEVFDHYVTVLNITDRFDSKYPEQNLWNYVHRANGNMPWTQLQPQWATYRPDWPKVLGGLKTMHHKFWRGHKDARIQDLAVKSRYKMEGYWGGLL